MNKAAKSQVLLAVEANQVNQLYLHLRYFNLVLSFPVGYYYSFTYITVPAITIDLFLWLPHNVTLLQSATRPSSQVTFARV